MNDLEKLLLRGEVGDVEPQLCICSKTRVDAGRWWRRTPLWLCIVGDELILLAVARRRYIEKVAIADCQASHYSAVTGELVIDPGESLRFSRVGMSPRDALSVLRVLKSNHQTNHQHLILQP